MQTVPTTALERGRRRVEFELGGYWQSPVNPVSTVGRGVPDVALDADPTSGVYLWLDGAETCCYGGTSLSSPMALGVWARLESAHNNKLGFAGIPLYRGATPLPSPASPVGITTSFSAAMDCTPRCRGMT
jgi:subtilase family serine protease